MARSISVKINTADVISMIEEKVAEYEKQIADYPADLAQYESDYRNWAKKVGSLAIELIASGNHFDGETHRDQISIGKNWNNLAITLGDNLVGDLKDQEPKRPESITGYGSVSQKVEELNKTLKLLRLTPQETVTSSTYNSVLELL
jgi:hypothetical protein